MVDKVKKKVHNHWLILVILALAQFMVVLDVSVVNVALPAIKDQFHMTTSNLQWIVTAYTLAFGGFLLFGGRAADLYGRRRLFMGGITLFALASLLNGFAQSGGMLIGMRAVQGFAAALMSPAALSIVLINYKEGHERNVALAVWGAVASGGAAAGVLVGGILTQYLSWRWNFFINLPVAIGVLIAAYRMVPKHESEETHNDLDLPGAVSVTASMMLLVYTLVQAPIIGWTDGTTLLRFAASAALLAFFIWNESRVKNPLMPLRIFKIRNLTGANLTIFPIVASMFSMFYFLSLYLQTVLDYTPVKTGFSFLPVPITIALVASNIPRLIQKIGYKPILVVAPLLIGTALFIFAHLPVEGSYVTHVLPGLIVLGMGMGMSFVAVTIAATSGVAGHESGLASGILNTSQQIGGALGLAVLTGIAASHTAEALKHLPSSVTAPKAVQAYAQVQGFHAAFYAGVIFTLLASLVALTVIKQTRMPKNVTEAAMAGGH